MPILIKPIHQSAERSHVHLPAGIHENEDIVSESDDPADFSHHGQDVRSGMSFSETYKLLRRIDLIYLFHTSSISRA